MDEERTNIRFERIQRLLRELEYEITRGMLGGEIDETISFQFVVPLSRRMPEGIVLCELRTRPTAMYAVPLNIVKPRLRVVEEAPHEV